MQDKFTFRGVGQGLFYTGSLLNWNYNFVYDCGCSSQKSILSREIDLYGKELDIFCRDRKQKIDFVVISHLHRDHYSGLYELLKKRKANKIYLPYLGDYSKNVLQLYFYYDIFVSSREYSSNNELLYDFILSLYKLNDLRDNDLYDEVEQVETIEISINENSNNTPYWKFHLLCKRVSQGQIKDINEKCESILNANNFQNMVDFIASSKKNPDKIAEVYRSVFSRDAINDTSIVMIHYPLIEYKSIKYCNYNTCDLCGFVFPCCHKCIQSTSRGVTLLTGDVELDIDMKKNIEQYIDVNQVDIMQVPHHGAKKNWQSFSKYNVYGSVNVISFGYGNKYRHPNVETINDLISKKMKYYCATQNQSFFYFFN